MHVRVHIDLGVYVCVKNCLPSPRAWHAPNSVAPFSCPHSLLILTQTNYLQYSYCTLPSSQNTSTHIICHEYTKLLDLTHQMDLQHNSHSDARVILIYILTYDFWHKQMCMDILAQVQAWHSSTYPLFKTFLRCKEAPFPPLYLPTWRTANYSFFPNILFHHIYLWTKLTYCWWSENVCIRMEVSLKYVVCLWSPSQLHLSPECIYVSTCMNLECMYESLKYACLSNTSPVHCVFRLQVSLVRSSICVLCVSQKPCVIPNAFGICA